MTAKPVPEHIDMRVATDEQLRTFVDAIAAAFPGELTEPRKVLAEVSRRLTELQHRREAEAEPAFWHNGQRQMITNAVKVGKPVDEEDARWISRFDQPLYAASPSSPASGVRVKALRWVPYNDGVRAKSILRGIYAVLHDGDDPDEWSARYDGRVLGYHRSQSDGEAACQSHFDAAIRSALGEHP